MRTEYYDDEPQESIPWYNPLLVVAIVAPFMVPAVPIIRLLAFVWVMAVYGAVMHYYSVPEEREGYHGPYDDQYSIRRGANLADLPRDSEGNTWTIGLKWLSYPDTMAAHFEIPVGLCYYLSTRINCTHTAASQYPTISALVRSWCKDNNVEASDTAYYVQMTSYWLRPSTEIWPKISAT